MQSNSVQSTHIVSPHGHVTAAAIPADSTYSPIYSASVIASRILCTDRFYCREVSSGKWYGLRRYITLSPLLIDHL